MAVAADRKRFVNLKISTLKN
jgi:ribosomal protein S18 acetylase RimI-like enzyme